MGIGAVLAWCRYRRRTEGGNYGMHAGRRYVHRNIDL